MIEQSATNILRAIVTVVNTGLPNVLDYYRSENKINLVGDALELFARDIFANSITINNLNEKYQAHRGVFSWGGNANNPPDFMIRGGDAVEVKKITSLTARIALNSSYPSAKLRVDNPMILEDCRNSENWTEKDNIYFIGSIVGQTKAERRLSSLWLVYGDCYAANKEVYERIRNTITTGIREIHGVELSPTKELARVNKVDPLGITNLRVRGMWDIAHPIKVFNYLNISINSNKSFYMYVLMKNSKYYFFPIHDIKIIENLNISGVLNIRNVQIISPNNTMEQIDAKLITYEID